MNDGAGDERGSSTYTENNNILHFNRTSVQEEGCDVVSTIHSEC